MDSAEKLIYVKHAAITGINISEIMLPQ